MKIFISWSGEKSKQVALLLEEWIKMVIQASQPWVSTNIQSGSLWFQELNEQLADVSLGIVCITAENKENPWIMFEAGALAKGLSTNRVCTLLIDLKNEDIHQPLAQFNHTKPDREGMLKLLNTINNHLANAALPQHILQKVFDKNYSDFESKLQEILKLQSAVTTTKVKRENSDILNEVLQTVRGFDKRLQSLETPSSIKNTYLTDINTYRRELENQLKQREAEADFGDENTKMKLASEMKTIRKRLQALVEQRNTLH